MSYLAANRRPSPFDSPKSPKKKATKSALPAMQAPNPGIVSPAPAMAPPEMVSTTPPPPAPPSSPMDPPAQRKSSVGTPRRYFGARDKALEDKADHKAAGLTNRHYGMNNELLSARTPEGGMVTGEKKSNLVAPAKKTSGSLFDPPEKKKKPS